jgi:iron complex outermembrane receptor protein
LRLVNGSSASGIPASVDLNILPANMISRIEVLQSGASPIYGSDAIAGVVNIITKQNQEGLNASAQFGTFRQGDGHTQDYNASYGIKLDRTSIVVGGSYVKQEAVNSSDRAISLFPNPGSTSCAGGGCSSATPFGRFLVNNPLDGSGLNLTLKAAVAGKPRFDPLNPTGPNSDFTGFTTASRFNFAPFNLILTPSERYGGFISVRHEINENINLRIKAVYNRRNSKNQAAPLPLFVGPDAGNGNLLDRISIDATNPFNPFGVTLSAGGAGNPPQNYSFIGRRFVENGNRRYSQSVDTVYLTATLDGKFQFASHDWYWDANFAYGNNKAKQTFLGNVNADKLRQALGPVALCTGVCVPFNIFGGQGSITPAQIAFVTFVEHDRSDQRLADASFNLTGELFELPAGPIGVAVGYEHRDQRGSFDPDPVVAAGFGSDIPALPSFGQFNIDEAYIELRAPLLKDVPGFKSLEANFAARTSNYSTFGSTTTLTAGGTWQPANDLLLRGSWSQGFRAPSIGELFGTPSRFDQELVDPCSDLNNSGASATIKANCIARGVPANGSYVQPNPQLSVVTGGNLALNPEKSRSLVFGGAYSPAWARENGFASQFSIEANYYDVRVNGAIAPIGADVLLGRCAATLDAFSCAAVTRTANGNVAQISGLLQNIGAVKTRSLDLTVNYRTPGTPAGSFGLYWASTFLLSYTESVPATNGSTLINRLGTERGSPDQTYPRYKSTGVVDWTLGDFASSFTGRYVSAVTESQNTNKLGSRFYSDVQLTWTPSQLDKRFAFTIGVNNLFNITPPDCISCGLNNFDPTTYDVPGQFGYVRVSFKM